MERRRARARFFQPRTAHLLRCPALICVYCFMRLGRSRGFKPSLIIIMRLDVRASRPTLRYGLRSAYDLINLCACVRACASALISCKWWLHTLMCVSLFAVRWTAPMKFGLFRHKKGLNKLGSTTRIAHGQALMLTSIERWNFICECRRCAMCGIVTR